MNVEARPQVEVKSSVMNFFDKSTLFTLIWPVGKYVKTVQEAGYEGLEWHPIRLLSGWQIKAGLLNQQEKDGIKSAHQSWRSEKNIREALNHPNRALAVVSYAVLPEKVKSLDDIEQLQRAVGRKLPVVLYPPQFAEESGTDRPFAEKTFQPTPEIMQALNVKTPEELSEEAHRRGYTGLCLDLFHMRKEGEIDLNPWQKTLPKLLPYTQEIHVSAGRIDNGDGKVDTMTELNDLLRGTNTTDLPKMLKAVKENNWNGRVVTEIPVAALHLLAGQRSKFMSPKELVGYHARIIETVKTLLS